MPDYGFLKGTGVALITPFKKDKSIDFEALEKVIEQCVIGGVESLVVLGTTGESVTLSKSEKRELVQFSLKTNRGRAKFIVGIGGNNTAELVDELLELDPNGIDAILSSSPAYNKPSQEGIFQHYMAFEKASPLPIIIYNVPARTASNITAETCLRLAHASEKFAAVKEASGDLGQATKILKDRPPHFLVLSGDDPLALGLMGIGGDGVISVIANAYPAEFSEMIRSASNNNYAQARLLNQKLFDLHKWLYVEGNPAGIKAACHLKGLCKNLLRLPLVPLSETNFQNLQLEMNRIGN